MITLTKTIEYDPQEFRWFSLLNISDRHGGHADSAKAEHKKVLKENLGEPNQYLITNGDDMDCVTTRDKRFQMNSVDPVLRSCERPDEILDLQFEEAVDIYTPHKEQIIGMGLGNHELDIIKYHNTNVHRRVCNALGVPTLGYASIIRLIFRAKGGRSRMIKVLQHHGFGGSTRTEGGSLSTFASYANYFNVDVAFFGHKHDYVYKRFPRIGVDRKADLCHEDIIVALTGSFLKTFNDSDIPNYAEKAGYRPTVLRGGWVLKFIPDHDGGVRTKMSEA